MRSASGSGMSLSIGFAVGCICKAKNRVGCQRLQHHHWSASTSHRELQLQGMRR